MTPSPNTGQGLGEIARLVGTANLITKSERTRPWRTDARGFFEGPAQALVRPGSRPELAAVVAHCCLQGWPVVPIGGNTGMCGGAVPHGGQNTVMISTDRLNRILRIDPDEMVIVAEAGVVLSDLQRAAEELGCLFPLSLGSEGSCTIGGNVSTNAGGVNVLHYGNTRDLVLGLEVVLPDGQIWDGLRTLRKDNSGYSLRNLYIGAEGTLGIVTAVALKMFPSPPETSTAFVAINDPGAAVALLRRLRARLGNCITAFELIPRVALDFAIRYLGPITEPLSARHEWHVLIETAAKDATSLLAQGLSDCGDLVPDGVIAASGAQRAAFWKLRELGAGGHQTLAGAIIKHDISVPVSRIPDMIRLGTERVQREHPGTTVIAFGHLGDGNLHFNLVQPQGEDPAAFRALTNPMNRIVHDLVAELGGSISAEHGIGLLKIDELARYADPVELDLMRRIKSALDPQGRMNPGKIF